MAATLLAVLVALAIGHLAPGLAANLRRYGWHARWLRWLNAQFPEGSFWRSRYGVALALVLPVLLVGALQWSLRQAAWPLPALLFGIAALFYSWGPRDLDVDVQRVLDATDTTAQQAALASLYPREPIQHDSASLIDLVFRNARQRWFGVLFWFAVLGPVGAVAYRLSTLAAEQDAHALPQDTLQGARRWLMLLDWPVTQLMTLSLALVGNFDSVAAAWREDGAFALRTRVLSFAARACVRSEIAAEVADFAGSGVSADVAMGEVFGELPELRDAMSLAWRILVLWLALIALFVVAGFAG